MSKWVMAVDGGGDQAKGTKAVHGTGWAALRVHEDRPPELMATGLIRGGPTPFLAEMTNASSPIREFLTMSDQLVVENFKLLNPRAKIDPLEIVGMVRMYGAMTGIPVAVQMPGQRTIVSHDDLKRIGMWPGGAGHADEAQAVRHALAWASLQGNLPTISLLSPDPGDEPEPLPQPNSW